MADVEGSQGMEEESGPGGPGAPTPLSALEVRDYNVCQLKRLNTDMP